MFHRSTPVHLRRMLLEYLLPPTEAKNDSNGDQIGAIIGAVAGVILFLVIAWMFFRSHKKKRADQTLSGSAFPAPIDQPTPVPPR